MTRLETIEFLDTIGHTESARLSARAQAERLRRMTDAEFNAEQQAAEEKHLQLEQDAKSSYYRHRGW
jgi:hypothetical protein